MLESFDGFSGLRNVLRKLAAERGDWAGIPMPIESHRLVIEPRYPMAKELSEISQKPEDAAIDAKWAGTRIRNIFHAGRRGMQVVIFERDGKIDWGWLPAFHHLAYDLTTLGASDAWGLEQEHNALRLLGTLLRHRQYKQYLLTGMFLEKSARSGLTYLFRKLKPTVVLDAREDSGKRDCRILCALCMHPIAYYEGSWAGAMAPTDDVIAHLMLMRGDEHMLWRRCNQHAPHLPEAGL